MNTLTMRIERYLKDMLEISEANTLEMKRKDLAEVFSCVPSQINYVLETRFRDEQGYHVISQRGAGGGFRIIRLEIPEETEAADYLSGSVGEEMTFRDAKGFLERLVGEEIIDRREYMLIMSMISPEVLAPAQNSVNRIRSNMIRNALVTLLRMDY